MSRESTEIEHVPRSTFFWIIGSFITIQIVAYAALFGLLTDRIDRNEARIDAVYTDIRSILVGIEEIKGRLNNLE